MYNVNMVRFLQFTAILTLTVSLCALRPKGENELQSATNKQKGLKMIQHRPWYSGKRVVFPLHSEVGKKKISLLIKR